MKRSTMPRTRTKPRRTTSPCCSVRSCKKKQDVGTLCITHAERRADAAFSLFIRARDGRCTAAGMFGIECKGNLQAAHVVGRRRYSVRFDPENVHALCQAHHYHVDRHGSEAAKCRWAIAAIGGSGFNDTEGYFDLMDRADTYVTRRAATESALAVLKETP